MTYPQKQMAITLTVSSIFVIFNIIAVMLGKADIYYSHIEHFFVNLLL